MPSVSYPNTTSIWNVAYWANARNWGSVSGSANYTVTSRSSRSGFRYPDRQSFAKANGYLPNNGYSGTNYVHARMSSKWTINSANGYNYRNGEGPMGIVPWYPGWSSSAITSAVATLENVTAATLNSKVRDVRISSYETVYEMAQTSDMILSRVKQFAKAAGQVKRGRFIDAAKTLGMGGPQGPSIPRSVTKRGNSNRGPGSPEALANAWLEYRYGWTPLCSDIHGILTYTYDRMKEDHNNGTTPIEYVTVYDQKQLSTVTVVDAPGYGTDPSTGAPLGFIYAIDTVTTHTVGVSRTALFRIENKSVASAQQLGLTNPLLTAWELVPSSFIVDWFVNVGDVLEQLDAWTGKSYISGTKTVRLQVDAARRPRLTSYSSGMSGVFTPGYHKVTGTNVNRVVVSSPPTVSLRIQPNLTTKRVIDAIALIPQLFK